MWLARTIAGITTSFGLALFAIFLASTIVATVRTARTSPPAPLRQAERGAIDLDERSS